MARLPEYPISHVRTGQYLPKDRRLWEGDVDLKGDAAGMTDSPVIESDYDVYLEIGNLVYVGEDCKNSDARFFLHVYPVDENDLPEHRRRYGFANRDFRFEDRVMRRDGKCVLTARLPEYPISHVRTGQYLPRNHKLWEVKVDLKGGATGMAGSR